MANINEFILTILGISFVEKLFEVVSANKYIHLKYNKQY